MENKQIGDTVEKRSTDEEAEFDLTNESIDSIKTSSEKMVAIVAGLITAYITALTYFKIPLNMDFYIPSFLAKTIVTLPIFLWLLCICLGILAYSAKGMRFDPNNQKETNEAYQENLEKTILYLDISKIFMTLGFLSSSFILIIGSSMQPIPVQPPAEIPTWVNYLLPVIVSLFIIVVGVWIVFKISNYCSDEQSNQNINVSKIVNVVNNKNILYRKVLSQIQKVLSPIQKVLSRINNHRKFGFDIIVFIWLCIVIIGYIILVIGIASYVPIPVQFVVNNDQVPVFTNMSINVDNQTMTTMPMMLISEDDKYYRVKTNNQTIIRFNKDMVKGMVYYTNAS